MSPPIRSDAKLSVRRRLYLATRTWHGAVHSRPALGNATEREGQQRGGEGQQDRSQRERGGRRPQ